MKRIIETTEDGSTTLRVEAWDEPYHSKHGAIREAYHVFIEMGLGAGGANPVQLLEMGFGTGLNAFITFLEAINRGLEVSYTAIEAFPVTAEEVRLLNYVEQLNARQFRDIFYRMHSQPWGEMVSLSDRFRLHKRQTDFMEVTEEAQYDLIYFDAFGARVQPELWTEVLFSKMFRALRAGGLLVTYAAKGSVRRAMHAVGFQVERLPGPPGKREMLRATRPLSGE